MRPRIRKVGRSPLVAAVKDKNLGLIHTLLRKGAQVNCGTWVENALTMAARSQDLKITQLLLDNRGSAGVKQRTV